MSGHKTAKVKVNTTDGGKNVDRGKERIAIELFRPSTVSPTDETGSEKNLSPLAAASQSQKTSRLNLPNSGSTGLPSRRRRGRPPGSKNLPKKPPALAKPILAEKVKLANYTPSGTSEEGRAMSRPVQITPTPDPSLVLTGMEVIPPDLSPAPVNQVGDDFATDPGDADHPHRQSNENELSCGEPSFEEPEVDQSKPNDANEASLEEEKNYFYYLHPYKGVTEALANYQLERSELDSLHSFRDVANLDGAFRGSVAGSSPSSLSVVSQETSSTSAHGFDDVGDNSNCGSLITKMNGLEITYCDAKDALPSQRVFQIYQPSSPRSGLDFKPINNEDNLNPSSSTLLKMPPARANISSNTGPPAVRRRGRPPGSKNLPKKHPITMQLVKKAMTNIKHGIPSYPTFRRRFSPVKDFARTPDPALSLLCTEVIPSCSPPPTGNQFSGNSITDGEDFDRHYPGYPESPYTKSEAFIFEEINLQPYKPEKNIVLDDADYSDCIHLYRNVMGVFTKYQQQRSEMDSLRVFQEVSRICLDEPLTLEKVNLFVSSIENGEDPRSDLQETTIVASYKRGCDVSSPAVMDIMNRLQVNSGDPKGVLERLDAIVKERFSNDPDKFKQYVDIMSKFIEFDDECLETSASACSLDYQMQFQTERQHVLERVLELLKDESDLITVFRQLFSTNELIHSDFEADRLFANKSNGTNAQVENPVHLTEEHGPPTETVSDEEDNTHASESSLKTKNSEDVRPEVLKIAAVGGDESQVDPLSIDLAILIVRMDEHPDLFSFCSSDFTDMDVFTQILTDRVSTIIVEDMDRDKWKTLLLQAFSLVFVRAPRLRAPIKRLLCRQGTSVIKKTTPFRFPGKLSTATRQVASLSPEGSYRKVPSLEGTTNSLGRTKLCSEVLNEELELTSPNTRFKLPHRSEIDITLDTVEDARYEVDLMLHRLESTIDVLVKVRKKMCKMSQAELDHYQLDDLLGGESILHKKPFEWFYNGERVVVGLQNFPSLFVPPVLESLETKRMQWQEMMANWNAIFRNELERWMDWP